MLNELTKKALDVTSTRSKVIANNIANINTNGYKRYYVNFEDNLKSASDKIDVKRDDKTSIREDGNNVNIDSEMVDQASNTLMYNALITDINKRISIRNYIITEGKR